MSYAGSIAGIINGNNRSNMPSTLLSNDDTTYRVMDVTNSATENIRNLSLKRSLFCLMHTPCGHDIRYYCLDKFQNILESYHGVKTTDRSYTINLKDYLDTSINLETLCFDTCEYYELKPKQGLLTELKEMLVSAVKDNHWNDTRLMYMFS